VPIPAFIGGSARPVHWAHPGETTMTKKKLFRRVLDSLIEGRSRQAQRYIDQYLKDRQEPAKHE
jgi:hypothetical protein